MPTLRIRVTGQVQGLGFRPHVYRLATSMGLVGTVANTSAGVEIVVQGEGALVFADRLRDSPPPLARVTSFQASRIGRISTRDFRIVPSSRSASSLVDVLPDIATCPECRRELLARGDRRFGYPFINCTQCGPRYTIIESLPYDRPRTTMKTFEMCEDCSHEYQQPDDRRFHAQPDACHSCGPSLTLLNSAGQHVPGNPVVLAARAIAAGRIVAVKSLGGFQLACDARNVRAVNLLRRRKSRPSKPFAVMCRTVSAASGFCRVDKTGRALLTSPAAPVVLLQKKKNTKHPVAVSVAPKNGRLGVMLPFTPLHILLLNEAKRALRHEPVLVMTSANWSDEPLIHTQKALLADLAGMFDLALTHDRQIANRCDDSVVLSDHPPVVVRRARGYAPQPVVLDRTFHVKHPTLALGGELRNCFVLAAGNRAFASPYLGRLASVGAERFFMATLERYMTWTGIKPVRIACDLHPDYVSTRIGEQLSRDWRVPLVRVQHHFAHSASVIAEHGIMGPVLGVSVDGTGYGPDGATWGCEFLLVDRGLKWKRVGHLGYLSQTEVGSMVADPARVAACYLLQVLGDVPGRLGLRVSARRIRAKLESGPSVRTSSLGRLYDAVAAISGVCRTATFEGEAAIALESAVNPRERRGYAWSCADRDDGIMLIDPAPILRGVVADVLAGTEAGRIAARFHDTLIRALVSVTVELADRHRTKTVALSGGSAQNSVLRHGLTSGLTQRGLKVLLNRSMPANDGGISLGQAVAAGR